MSVMSCSRLGCDNIMCDRYSYEYGHICSECFDELVRRGVANNISDFMNTEKSELNVNKEDTLLVFDSIFGKVNNDNE